MVKLRHQRWESNSPSDLQDTIKHVLEGQRRLVCEKSLSVELDVASEAARASCPQGVLPALEHLIQLAIARSPVGGEVQISVCVTGRGLEIEVADAGDEQQFPRFNAFEPNDCKQVIDFPTCRADVNVFAAVCPQGGMAWTLLVKERLPALKVA